MSVLEAIVCASCPEQRQDVVTSICKQYNFQKAYGRSGDMVDTLSGKDWVGKWQAKVVMAAVTKAQTLNADRVKIVCIEGGKYCDAEYKCIPDLKRAISKEWSDSGNVTQLRVDCVWISYDSFIEDYPPLSNLNAQTPSATSTKSYRKAGINHEVQDNNTMVNNNKISNKSNFSKRDNSKGSTERNTNKNAPDSASSDLKPNQSKQNGKQESQKHSQNQGNRPQSTPENVMKESGNRQSKKGNLGGKVSTASTDTPQKSFKQNLSADSTKSTSKSNTSNENIACHTCQKQFGSYDALSNHLKSTDHTFMVYTCSICQDSYSVFDGKNGDPLSRLNQHMNSKGHLAYTTTEVKYSELEDEEENVDDDEANGNDWICGECQLTFSTQESFNYHQMSTGHRDPTCETCGRDFNSKISLQQHQEATGHIKTILRPQYNPVYNTHCHVCNTLGKSCYWSNNYLMCMKPSCSEYILKLCSRTCNNCQNGPLLQRRGLRGGVTCIHCHHPAQQGVIIMAPLEQKFRYTPLNLLSDLSINELKAYANSQDLSIDTLNEKNEICIVIYCHLLESYSLDTLKEYCIYENIHIPSDMNDTNRIINYIKVEKGYMNMGELVGKVMVDSFVNVIKKAWNL